LASSAQTLANVKARSLDLRNIHKILRRNDSYLARAANLPVADVRARGYSLILRGLCALAMTGWIAVSDGLIDRNGKPLGTDFSNVYATGTLTLKRRPAEACEPALQHAAEKGAFGGREVPSRAGIIRGKPRGLSRCDARDPAATGNAADRFRLPGRNRDTARSVAVADDFRFHDAACAAREENASKRRANAQ
jgi:hypothetical protein